MWGMSLPQCKYPANSCRAALWSANSNPCRKAALFRTKACTSTDPAGRLMCNSTASPICNSTGTVVDIPDSLMSIDKPGIAPSLLDRTVTSTSNGNLAWRRVSATVFSTYLAHQKIGLLLSLECPPKVAAQITTGVTCDEIKSSLSPVGQLQACATKFAAPPG